MNSEKPNLNDYEDPVDFLKAKLAYIKSQNENFTIKNRLKGVENLSPTLVTLILQKKRKITFNNLDQLVEFFDLTPEESYLFTQKIKSDLPSKNTKKANRSVKIESFFPNEIVSDWINIYINEVFYLPKVQNQPDLVYKIFESVADRKRIDNSIQFLLSSKRLLLDKEDKIVPNFSFTQLNEPREEDEKQLVKQLFQGALENISRRNTDITSDSNMSHVCLLPLNKKGSEELKRIIFDLHNRVRDYYLLKNHREENLFQVFITISKLTNFKEN